MKRAVILVNRCDGRSGLSADYLLQVEQSEEKQQLMSFDHSNI
jgi:hypothetical protein